MENDENKLLKWGFLLVTVLAVLWAAWRIMEYRPDVRPSSLPQVVYTGNLLDEDEEYTPEEAMQTMKMREFLEQGTNPSATPANPLSETNPLTPSAVVPQKNVAPAGAATVSKNNLPNYPKNNTTANPASSSRAIPMASTQLVGNPSANNTARPVGYGHTREEALSQQRNRMLAPYLVPNKNAQKNMDDMMAKLSANITRAVNRALKPRSKKEENIEKYLGRSSSGTATSSDPFQDIVNQISSQKENVVANMRQAFGSNAGNRAGELMDSFQQEMADAMSNPEMTAAQKADRAQKISNKYKKKLDKMSQENQFNQFAAQRVAEDNKQKEEIAKAYPDNPDFNAAAAQIIDKARERDLALALHPEIAEGDYYKTLLANQYQDQRDLEEAAKKHGVSTAPLHKWQNEQEQAVIKKLGEQEEEGKINSYKFTFSEKDIKNHEEQFRTERENIISKFEQSFGKEDTAQLETLLKEYNDKMIATMREPNTERDHADKKADIRNEYNRKFLEFQIEVIKKSAAPEEQKETFIRQLQAEIDAIPEPKPRIVGAGV